MMRAFEEEHGVRVCHAWGMTETSPLGSFAHPPAGLSAEDEWPYRISQGRFPASVEARLAAPDGSFAPWDGKSRRRAGGARPVDRRRLLRRRRR